MSYGQEHRGGNNRHDNSRRNPRDRQDRSGAPSVATGEPETVKVKWYNAEKGYGFVVTADNKDLFIHASVVKAAGLDSLSDNQELVIRRGPGRKAGTEAANEIVV